jgi:hypothetical protein
VTAHQRLIRETEARNAPLPVIASLGGYAVETISKSSAEPVILRYEWLGAIGRATIFVGLVSPTRELHGVACFGYGPAGPIRKLIGDPALCLERGACVHYAPRNAASYLITHACKLVYRLTGTPRFFAYGDPMAGEIWRRLPGGELALPWPGARRQRGPKRRFFVLPPGGDPDNPANWRTTRELRRGTRLTFAEARAQGWRIATREAKHVYATHVGRGRKTWLKTMPVLRYPAPQPELKRKRAC